MLLTSDVGLESVAVLNGGCDKILYTLELVAIKVSAPASVKGYGAADDSRLIEVYFGINTVSMM